MPKRYLFEKLLYFGESLSISEENTPEGFKKSRMAEMIISTF
jgi:hypothetical protein